MDLTPPTDRDLRILHTTRCIGYSTSERVAVAAGLTAEDTLDGLRSLDRDGLVSHVDGVFGGWSITDSGRTHAARRVAEELDGSGSRSTVETAYAEFLALNPQLLNACGDWQIRRVGATSIPNDHRDRDYDIAVIDRLARIDEEVQPVIAALAGVLPRFAPYRARLGRALGRVDAGEQRYFTDDMESYHTIWFQLHEDLLVTLGLERFPES
jgi:hypothetical protein